MRGGGDKDKIDCRRKVGEGKGRGYTGGTRRAVNEGREVGGAEAGRGAATERAGTRTGEWLVAESKERGREGRNEEDGRWNKVREELREDGVGIFIGGRESGRDSLWRTE